MDVSISYKNVFTMVAKAAGKINLETAVEYGTAIKDAIFDYDEDIRELILDFSEITFISSIGLKVVLEIYKDIEEKGGVVKVSGASEEVKNAFCMVGFDKFIAFE
ncbi:STAS domain-containing protein [bacterium]|nr:STAS domain-containing protein [bacterium]